MILNVCIPISARNYSNVAMVLLHAGADFDLANAQGCTPIHLAAREGLLGLAQSLCAFGCVVDTATSDGNFPLHLAAQNGHTEVVRCLCLAGCKIDVKNKDGVTPELAALSQGHGEISDLLKRLKRVRTNEEGPNFLIYVVGCHGQMNGVQIELSFEIYYNFLNY